MRFLADGPSIPDDLLTARDAGDVIFFCGAGVSRQRAGLPDFLKLGGDVIDLLGASESSLARRLFQRITEMRPMDGVGGLIATDRIFSLLEREFERREIQNKVALAIRSTNGVDLSAHQILLNLSKGRDGTVRLVTTNFDLLFESCVSGITSYGPPELTNPQRSGFQGIVHLHGRVNADYSGPDDEEFILSGADFGRAYLSEGWATRFMQSLLARFQIVFVGYAADDPPVQYLLEALNLHVGGRSRLFAFQSGSNTDDVALWENRGVRAIPFDSSNGYDTLWNSLTAWAERARDIDSWCSNVLTAASAGPASLDPHVRGQIAHVFSTDEGARRASIATIPLPASWLLALDPFQRFHEAGPVDRYGESSDRIDPYQSLSLDFDVPPQPDGHEDKSSRKRLIPEGSWDAFAPAHLDTAASPSEGSNNFCGDRVTSNTTLNTRLNSLSIWFQRVAHQPIALWWAAGRGPLHPDIVEMIQASLRQNPKKWPADIRRGWRFLFASWSDPRAAPDQDYFEVCSDVKRDGWSEGSVRDYADIFKPRLKVERKFGIRHPLSWTESDRPSGLLSFSVDYPRPYELASIPDEHLAYAISRFRENLDLARSFENEISGDNRVYLETTRPDTGSATVPYDSYGLTGPVALVQQLMDRLIEVAPEAARAEIARWPVLDHHIFGRLRIWAAASTITTPSEAAHILLGFPDDVFWGSQQQRDLLYAVRDRWADFSADERTRFEKRLLSTSFPLAESNRESKARVEAYHCLDRLYWLKSHGVTFSFDVEAKMAALQAIAQDWRERSGQEAAASHSPVVRGVGIDSDPRTLEHGPVSEILERSRAAGQSDLFDLIDHRPFEGLSCKKPARALAALVSAARRGDVPVQFWSDFLKIDRRKSDPQRRVRAIASRLATLPSDKLCGITYPVTEWLRGLGERVYREFAPLLDCLWDPLIAALSLNHEIPRHRVDSSWANDALNSPVGNLSSLLMKDPATSGLGGGQGFSESWMSKQEQLLALPADMRRQALVMVSFHLTQLFAVAPSWTEKNLLPVVADDGPDGDALWDGVLWAARPPTRALFIHLKPGLLARAISPKRRRAEASVIGAFLLIGWGDNSDAEPPEQLVTSAELREILVKSDDDLRASILWHLGRWSADLEGKWRARLVPFLNEVWPKHRALRTPEMSTRLVDLALTSGSLLPQVVDVILPRLVPVRGGMLRSSLPQEQAENHPAQMYPAAMLDLLWSILAEDARLWPCKVEDTLDVLSEAPETRADTRLSELRRRRSS